MTKIQMALGTKLVKLFLVADIKVLARKRSLVLWVELGLGFQMCLGVVNVCEFL